MNKPSIPIVIMILGAIAYAAICFHSVKEIHYLKSFFPRSFTVEEAFYAAGVELIKILIIGVPFAMLFGTCFLFLAKGRGTGDGISRK